MCVCVRTCIYVHIYTHVYMYIYACVHVFVHLCVHTHVYVYVYAYLVMSPKMTTPIVLPPATCAADACSRTVGDLYLLMHAVDTKLSYVCGEIAKLNVKIDKDTKHLKSKIKANDKDHMARDAERNVKDAERDALISSLQHDFSNVNKRAAEKMHGGSASEKVNEEGNAPKVQRVCSTRKDCEMPKHIFNNGASKAWGWKKVIDTKKYSKSGFSTMEEAVQALADFLRTRNSARNVNPAAE